MNKLMMILNRCVPMDKVDDVGGGAGGGAGDPTPVDNNGGTPSASGGAGDPPNNGGGSSIDDLAAQAAAAKPFLGDPPKDPSAAGDPPKDPNASGDPPKDPPKPVEITEQSYIDGIKKDEKLLGNEKSIQLDQGLIKAIAPTLKECNISVENANKLANALAAAQVESAREAMRQRVEYFETMKKSAMEKYAAKDWETINAGINAAFDPKGVMNHVVRHSELGADPEFLALMYEWGKRSQTDGVSGAAAAGGIAAGDPNSTDGIAKLW